MHSSFPIDAVIPWVSGEDPAHQQKLNSYLPSSGRKRPKSASPTRYAERGELEFCIVSILKYAPWIRKIFIVTDNQTPHFMLNDPGHLKDQGIFIVDHKDIFEGYRDLLPTFNSLSIETMIWRIPGLSEHFIYFNDDLALLKPTPATAFFEDNEVVLRGAYANIVKRSLLKKIKQRIGLSRSTHTLAQSNGAITASPLIDSFLKADHIPHPIRKSTLERFYKDNPHLLPENAQHRFRHYSQFWPIGLANQLEQSLHNPKIKNASLNVYLNPEDMNHLEFTSILSEITETDGKHFICTQSLDQASTSTYREWLKWMKDNIGTISESGCA